jgi:hypothetical protein
VHVGAQRVEDDDVVAGGDEGAGRGGADEARPARDEDAHAPSIPETVWPGPGEGFGGCDDLLTSCSPGRPSGRGARTPV